MTDKPKRQLNVVFQPGGIAVQANPGDSILKTALKAGVHLSTTCGGSGTCGSCRIKIQKGDVDRVSSEAIGQDEINQGIRLACQSYVSQDVTVEILANTSTSLEAPTAETSLSLPNSPAKLNPVATKHLLCLPVPTAGDNRADLKRLRYALKNHGYDEVMIDYPVVKGMPAVLREKAWEVTATLIHSTPLPSLSRLESGDTTTTNFGAAIDLGTTAIRARLINLNTGSILAEETAYNQQRDYGEDIISRISFCQKSGGIDFLQKLAVDTLNVLIHDMAASSGIDTDNISCMVVAGNTVMIQLLLAIDPEPLRLSPYVPAISSVEPLKTVDLGINLGRHCYLHIIPAVASYVGGDIVAGVAACGMHESDKTSLYIDIGTNGEIVVGNRDWMVTAACSAGPTFEGGGIKHGMLAIPGAIEDFSLEAPDATPRISVIGSKSPAGICGSGLINTVSELFSAGILSRNGKFNPEVSCSRVRKGEDGLEYVLAEGNLSSRGRDIVLTEIDIDNFIRSKAAIYAGCQTLMESVGIDMSELDNIIIAGTFGNHIDTENAIKVGLLPDLPRDKFQFIGNGSLLGACTSIISREQFAAMLRLADIITGVELSENGAFMDNYVASLFLPHTDLEKFPSVGN